MSTHTFSYTFTLRQQQQQQKNNSHLHFFFARFGLFCTHFSYFSLVEPNFAVLQASAHIKLDDFILPLSCSHTFSSPQNTFLFTLPLHTQFCFVSLFLFTFIWIQQMCSLFCPPSYGSVFRAILYFLSNWFCIMYECVWVNVFFIGGRRRIVGFVALVPLFLFCCLKG